MKHLLGKYKNGNYNVMVYSDGTKIRFNNEDTLIPEFPESIDMKISNRCNMGCPFCHEKSIPNGELANLNHPILDFIRPWTELALGGGNVFEHPGLYPFLERMNKKNVICNITVHLVHFEQYYSRIKYYTDHNLIRGVGISINGDVTDKQIELIKTIPNAVVHVIAGVVKYSTLMKLAYHNIKLLILGYKTYGHGEEYFAHLSSDICEKIDYISKHMYELREWFPILSFDNLAIKQLHLKEQISEKEWEKTYMGDDGQFTMYIDLVKEEFAKSSVSPRKLIAGERDVKELFVQVQQGD